MVLEVALTLFPGSFEACLEWNSTVVVLEPSLRVAWGLELPQGPHR